MSRTSVVTVACPPFVRPGHVIAVGDWPDCEFMRVVARNGNELTVTRWRWYHKAGGWPARIWRRIERERDAVLLAIEDAVESWREYRKPPV